MSSLSVRGWVWTEGLTTELSSYIKISVLSSQILFVLWIADPYSFWGKPVECWVLLVQMKLLQNATFLPNIWDGRIRCTSEIKFSSNRSNPLWDSQWQNEYRHLEVARCIPRVTETCVFGHILSLEIEAWMIMINGFKLVQQQDSILFSRTCQRRT